MINTTHNKVDFKNKINGGITSSGVIDQESINPHELCYQYSKYGPDFLFGKLGIIDSRDQPYSTSKIK